MKEQPKVFDRVAFIGERICLIGGVKGKRGFFVCLFVFFQAICSPYTQRRLARNTSPESRTATTGVVDTSVFRLMATTSHGVPEFSLIFLGQKDLRSNENI